MNKETNESNWGMEASIENDRCLFGGTDIHDTVCHINENGNDTIKVSEKCERKYIFHR